MAAPELKHFFVSDDGKISVPSMPMEIASAGNPDERFKKIVSDLKEYKWREEDTLLTAYPKNGTHLLWEIMTMLLQDSASYILKSKTECMIDTAPVSFADKNFPSPRVLNTHLRLDVLPSEFHGKRTIWVIRNPKDTVVSFYHHITVALAKMLGDKGQPFEVPFSDFLKKFLFSKDWAYGSYFDYVEYMWSQKDNPNILLLFFEDAKLKPLETVQKVNDFMGTNRSPEVIQRIADATNFTKMKIGKSSSMDEREGFDKKVEAGTAVHLYRKGVIGDWKNHFSTEDNKIFDTALEAWKISKEIPFQYE